MQDRSDRAAQILLVEDNHGDALLVREILCQVALSVELHHVADGVEALAFLGREHHYGKVPRPDLMLLDLNMPRMTGQEFLAAVKADLRYRTIPVLVLTSSTAEMDILNSYQLQASCYVTKPVDFTQFEQTILSIVDFWLRVARLPTTSPRIKPLRRF